MRPLALLAALALAGCGPQLVQAQARAAAALAHASNRGLDALVDVYKAEGLAAIARADSAAAAVEALEDLRANWRPVWGTCVWSPGGQAEQAATVRCDGGAWRALRAAHDAWAAELEGLIADRGVIDAVAMTERARVLREAYCAARVALPASARATLPGSFCADPVR